MSRAFVREGEGEPEALPERTISPHPNFVTARGLRLIEARVHELEGERSTARDGGDNALRARVERDLRYWSARRASARLVEPAASTERVRFGMNVTLEAQGGARQSFRLVGEDEADAAGGLISWVAPLARAMLGREVGDSVAYQGGEALIVAIEA